MSKFNEWWLSLPQGRRDVLIEDKWRLVDAAFEAGQFLSKPIAEIKYVDYPCAGLTKNKEKPYYTVTNTSATVILQSLREAEEWALNSGMRIKP